MIVLTAMECKNYWPKAKFYRKVNQTLAERRNFWTTGNLVYGHLIIVKSDFTNIYVKF